jgi:uncharacterized protein (TIGR02246 family)
MFAIAVVYLAFHAMGKEMTMSARAQNHRSDQDEDAIKQLIRSMTEAFNQHDAPALARLYTANADLVTVYGTWLQGTATIERGLEAFFQTIMKEGTLKTLDVQVRFLKPDVAIAHVTNELRGEVSANGQQLPPQQELSIRVCVKENGIWRVAAFHNTIKRPSQAPAR